MKITMKSDKPMCNHSRIVANHAPIKVIQFIVYGDYKNVYELYDESEALKVAYKYALSGKYSRISVRRMTLIDNGDGVFTIADSHTIWDGQVYEEYNIYADNDSFEPYLAKEDAIADAQELAMSGEYSEVYVDFEKYFIDSYGNGEGIESFTIWESSDII